ncbi:MAG: type II secretion system protein GspD, partial [Phycisphaerae bacterium]
MTLWNRIARSVLVLSAVTGFLLIGPSVGLAQTVEDTTVTEETADAQPTAEATDASEDPIRKLKGADTFEIHMQDLDIRRALQMLSSQGQRNIIATKGVTGTVSADLYSVTFMEALEAVLTAGGYVYEERGNFIYVYTPEEYKNIRQAQRKTEVRAFHLAYVTATDAQTLLAPALSSDGTISISPNAETGISSSKTNAGGNNYATNDVIIVRDYEENITRVAQLVHKIDVKPEQVMIEATLLRATLDEENAMGIDFNTLSGVNFSALGGATSGGTNLNLDSVPTGNLDGADVTTFQTDFNAGLPSGGFSFGFISNDAAFFIRALEGVTDVNVLANPKLLVINKQRGEVMIGKRDGYLTTTVTETVATQTVQFLETGTRLIVRPFVGRNGYIRLEIHPEDSSGNVEQVGSNVLPTETTTEVTSNVLVRDGRTIVIGGLFREVTNNGRSQVPVLGNIPYLGTAFRRTSSATVREEVIILITPRIIRQEGDEAVSQKLKDDVEKFRVGMRKGVHWWGRGRLAQTHLRWAKEELRKGRVDKALWNLDMALSMNPRLPEAIRMKERLTQKAYWSSEAKTSSVKYIIEKMMANDLGIPVNRITAPGKPAEAVEIDPVVRDRLG